jgi:hypothetical protein
MDLEELVAVSGLPGLYRMAANRSNGLIVEDLETGKRRFASARKHNFTPLASIGIFTDDGDSVPLKDVFRNMKDQLQDNPPVDPNADKETLFEYFDDILPNYDRDRVYPKDIKKIITWFDFLQAHGWTGEELSQEEE